MDCLIRYFKIKEYLLKRLLHQHHLEQHCAVISLGAMSCCDLPPQRPRSRIANSLVTTR